MPLNYLAWVYGRAGSIKKGTRDQEGAGLVLMEELEKDKWVTEVDILFHPVLSPWWKRMPPLPYRCTYLRLQFWLCSCHMQMWRIQADTKGSEQQITLAHSCLRAFCVLSVLCVCNSWMVNKLASNWWEALHGDTVMYKLAHFQNRLLTYVCKTCVSNLVTFSQMCGGIWNINIPSNIYFLCIAKESLLLLRVGLCICSTKLVWTLVPFKRSWQEILHMNCDFLKMFSLTKWTYYLKM